jgi:hypothetical protein
MKNVHVFRILIRIEVVEDLLFYHYPREELLADGKVPWRDFRWQWGRADGELGESDLHPLPDYVIKMLGIPGGIQGMMMMIVVIEGRDLEVGW